MLDESHDPTLKGRLDAAELRGVPVEVVVQLGHGDSLDISPEAMPGLVHRMITVTRRETGEHEQDVRVFRNLSSFVVRAPAPFVRCLAKRPEVIGIQANCAEREDER